MREAPRAGPPFYDFLTSRAVLLVRRLARAFRPLCLALGAEAADRAERGRRADPTWGQHFRTRRLDRRGHPARATAGSACPCCCRAGGGTAGGATPACSGLAPCCG